MTNSATHSPMYNFSARNAMDEAAFVAMILVIAQTTYYNLDGVDASNDETAETYIIGAYESAAFTISCLLAQRYNIGVGTSDVVESLEMHQSLTEKEREERIISFIRELNKAR